MNGLIRPSHFDLVRRFKQLFSHYQRSRDLIAMGAYQPGGDPLLDEAVRMYPILERFLQKGIDERTSYEEYLGLLNQIFATTG